MATMRIADTFIDIQTRGSVFIVTSATNTLIRTVQVLTIRIEAALSNASLTFINIRALNTIPCKAWYTRAIKRSLGVRTYSISIAIVKSWINTLVYVSTI